MAAGWASCARLRAFVAGLTVCGLGVVPLAAAGQAESSPDEAPAAPPLLPADVAWTLELDAGPLHAPAWGTQAAYVALRNGWLNAIELQSGEILWSVEQPADQPPVVDEQLVVTAEATRLTARRGVDGVQQWARSFETVIAAPLTFGNGWLIVATAGGDLFALRGQDGSVVWRRQIGATPSVGPSIAGSRLYLPLDDGRVVALALVTGEVLWESPLGGQPRQILPDEAIYVGSTDRHLYRLAFSDGDHDWYWRTGGDIVGVPAIDDRRVYFTARDNVLRALDRRNGARRWRRFLEYRPTSGPILAGSVLLVTGVSESALFFDAESGVPAGRYDAPGELASPPYLIPEPEQEQETEPDGDRPVAPRLALITTDGRLVALTAPAGPPRVSIAFPPHPLLPLPDKLAPALMIEWHPLRLPTPPMTQ